MTNDAGLRVIPVTEAPWADVRTVFGTKGDPATCWCQYYKVDAPTWKAGDVAAFEASLCEQVEHPDRDAGPGLLAYRGNDPVGWIAVEPRSAFTRIVTSHGFETADDPASIWSITCFVVRVGHRRSGVARSLLEAAIGHARANGAGILEAEPVDTSDGAKISSADLYHGPLSLFETAGFRVIGRPSERRAIVRLAL